MEHVEVDREEAQHLDGAGLVTIRCSCGVAVQGTGATLELARREAETAFRAHPDAM